MWTQNFDWLHDLQVWTLSFQPQAPAVCMNVFHRPTLALSPSWTLSWCNHTAWDSRCRRPRQNPFLCIVFLKKGNDFLHYGELEYLNLTCEQCCQNLCAAKKINACPWTLLGCSHLEAEFTCEKNCWCNTCTHTHECQQPKPATLCVVVFLAIISSNMVGRECGYWGKCFPGYAPRFLNTLLMSGRNSKIQEYLR